MLSVSNYKFLYCEIVEILFQPSFIIISRFIHDKINNFINNCQFYILVYNVMLIKYILFLRYTIFLVMGFINN